MKKHEHKLIKNISLLVGGTAFAQLISFLAIPFITRIFGPEAYGLLGTFRAIVAIFVPIAALTFPVAIVLPRNKKIAKKIITLSIYTTIIISTFILAILIIFYKKIIYTFQLEDLGLFLFLLPIATFMGGLLQIIEQWSIRNSKYKIIANTTAFQALITNTIIVIVGFFYPSPQVLISIESLKAMIKSFLITFKSIKLKDIKNVLIFDRKSLSYTFKKFKDFPLFRAPEVLLNSIGQNIPILMLTAWFGPVIAGFYTLSRTVLGVPAQLIGKSIGDVLYPYIAKAFNNDEDITKILTKTTLYLTILGVIPFGTIYFFGTPIFTLVFGSDWIDAGEVAKWISLWSFTLFINIPSIKTLPVISAQAFHLKFSAIMLIVRTSVMMIAYFIFKDEIIVIKAVSISSAVLNVILIISTIYMTVHVKKKL